MIPTLLAAWFFRIPGMAICLAATVLVLLTACLSGISTLEPTPPSLLLFLVTLLFLLGVGLVVCWLRYYLDLFHPRADRRRSSPSSPVWASNMAITEQEHEEIFVHLNHEMRTPLTIVYGNLQLLQEQQNRIKKEEQAELLRAAIQGCEDLQGTVNKLMHAFTITQEQYQLRCEPVPLLPVLREVLQKLPGASYPITVSVPDDLVVQVDRKALCEIFIQFLENVTLYTPAGTAVYIQARSAQEEHWVRKHQVVISVSDTGPGIPPEEIPTLFTRFSRLKRHSMGAIPGTGTGLYRCKMLVEAMGGHIWVESKGVPGKGSRFCISLEKTKSSKKLD
jgi:signal transduction histidine kinase